MTRFWEILAPAGHGVAEAVQLHLAARDLPFLREAPGPLPVLLPPDAGLVALCDAPALLAALPPRRCRGPVPEHDPHFLPGIFQALDRLDALNPAAFPADLDLHLYALRQELRPLEAALPDIPRADSDTSLWLAPLLWRIGLADRHFSLFLLSGLPRLARLHAAQNRLPLITELYDPGAGLRYLRSLAHGHHSPPPATDWSRALGPEGQEKSLLPRGQRRKNPSIGSPGLLR